MLELSRICKYYRCAHTVSVLLVGTLLCALRVRIASRDRQIDNSIHMYSLDMTSSQTTNFNDDEAFLERLQCVSTKLTLAVKNEEDEGCSQSVSATKYSSSGESR